MNSIVVHYQEIALKGKNRPWFLARLVRNLRDGLAGLDVKSVRALMGRIEVVLGPSAPVEAVSTRLRHTFGIANFSLAGRAPLDVDAIASALSDLVQRSREGTLSVGPQFDRVAGEFDIRRTVTQLHAVLTRAFDHHPG